nr:hypothetical protein [Tanacetum cinerariifolium]
EDQADDDIIGTLVTMSQKEKAEDPRSSSSCSLSLNYDNEFLNLSSDASLVVLVIPLQETTTTTPLTISTATTTTPIVPDLLPAVVQRVSIIFEIMKVKHEQAAKEKVPKFSSITYDQQADEEHKQKDILFKMMMSSKSYERHLAYKALYDALLESIFMDKNDMDKLDVDPASQRKRRHEDKDKDPSAGSNQRKKMKKQRDKSESLKKSSTFKESSKGNTP